METKAYACYNVDEKIRKISSSGGVYYLLAKTVINSGGVVYAACYVGMEVVHRKIVSVAALIPSCGSKYIPSTLDKTFHQVKCDLEDGKKVMFVGTPCQCAGLYRFLPDTTKDRLICVDFVCHGIPSKAAWRAYLSTLEKSNSIVDLNMRDKASGWSKYQYSWRITYGGKQEVLIPQSEVSYMKGFVKDLYLRPSCYACHFKGTERKTDITLADFWGVWEILPPMDDNKGTSLVIIHTQKGQDWFQKIQPQLIYQPVNLDQAIRYNPSILQSARITEKRQEFFCRLKARENFNDIIQDLLKGSNQISVIGKAKRKVIALFQTYRKICLKKGMK